MKKSLKFGVLILTLVLLISVVNGGTDIFRFSGTIGEPIPKDSDEDGVPDSLDLCPDSIGSVDSDGCTSKQFCNTHEVSYTKKGRRIHVDWYDYMACVKADWNDNEDRKYPRDCRVVRNRRTKQIYCTARRGAN